MNSNTPSVFDYESIINNLSAQADAAAKSYGLTNDANKANPKLDTELNAFFHGYVSALLSFDYGTTVARGYGNVRELNGMIRDLSEYAQGKFDGQGLLDRGRDVNRDQYNNFVGREIGEYAKENGYSRDQLASLVKDALDRGLLAKNEFTDPRIGQWDMTLPPAYHGPSPTSGIHPDNKDNTSPGSGHPGGNGGGDGGGSGYPGSGYKASEAGPANGSGLGYGSGSGSTGSTSNNNSYNGDSPSEGGVGRGGTLGGDRDNSYNGDSPSEGGVGRGGTLGGDRDYGGRNEGDKPGPGGWGPSPDDGFNEAGWGGDPYTGEGEPLVSPVVLDLDGDGFEIVSRTKSGVFFDYNGDGGVERSAWVTGGDGILAIDLAADGKAGADGEITQAKEFVFKRWSSVAQTDLSGLRKAFDSNKDGKLSAADKRFEEFRIWVDRNGDGHSDPGELKTLSQVGISSIKLTTTPLTGTPLPDGSIIHGTTVANRKDGKTISVADASFSIGRHNASVRSGPGRITFDYGDGTRRVHFVGTGEESDLEHLAKQGYRGAVLTTASGDSIVSEFDAKGKPAYISIKNSRGLNTRLESWETNGHRTTTRFASGAIDYTRTIDINGSLVAKVNLDQTDKAKWDINAEYYSAPGRLARESVLMDDGAVKIVVYEQDNKLKGTTKNDTLIGGDGNDELKGGAGNDQLSGRESSDRLYGEDGNDTLEGGAGIDKLFGDAGDDHLNAGAGDDSLSGGEGNDHLDGGDGRDDLTGDAGDDTLNGGADLDWMHGGDGTDLLYGGTGNDILLGGSGDDRLVGEDGKDILYGGDGRDILEGGTADDELRGEAGDDALHGGTGDDFLDGGEGNDALQGGDGKDGLIGSSGNDTLYGGAGDDGLVGGQGDDALYGGGDNDTLKGSQGGDVLNGEDGNDLLMGGADGDTLTGALGNDELYGDDGDDSLDGGAGVDTLWGGDGNDTLLAAEGNDVLDGGAGHDSVAGGLGDDMLRGGAGNDSLDGGGGNDQLFGGDGNDIMAGGPDVDYIDGGAGTDTIVFSGRRLDYEIRFNTAIGRYSIVDLRAGSPDGTDLADIEIFSFSDGQFTQASINYVTDTASQFAWNVDNSDGSRSILGWLVSTSDPSQWDAYVRHYNLAAIKMSETIIRHDGSVITYAWDVDGTETWDSFTRNYDTGARLFQEEYLNDDGTSSVNEWDHTGLKDWFERLTTYDAGNPRQPVLQKDNIRSGRLGLVETIERGWDYSTAVLWANYTLERNAAGLMLRQEYDFDDGSRTVNGWDYQDPNEPKQWKEYHEQYDSASRKTYDLYKYYSPVQGKFSSVERGWDFSTANWSSFEIHRDYLDRLAWQKYNFDNGTAIENGWDPADVQAWSEYQLNYDSQGRPVWRSYKYDDLTRIDWDWDSANAANWSEIVTWYDASAARFQKKTTYDDGSSTLEKWDPGDVQTWSYYAADSDAQNRVTEETYLFDNGTSKVKKWDRADSKSWAQYEADYDAHNPSRMTREKHLNDNGTATEEFWDRADTKTWDERKINYDSYSRKIWEKTLYDNKTYETEQKDYSGKNWDTITTYGRTYAGVQKTYYEVVTYNAGLFTETKHYVDAGEVKIWATFDWSFNGTIVMAAVTTFDNGIMMEYVPPEIMLDPDGWTGPASFTVSSTSAKGMTWKELLAFDRNGDGGIDLDTEMALAQSWFKAHLAEQGVLVL